MTRALALAFAVAFVLSGAAAPPPPSTAAPSPDPSLLKNLQWREVGPYRGGRADTVTGIAGDRLTYYFGSTGGGVWKTTDGGQTWKPVSDGFFGGSVDALAIAPSDP